MAVKDTTTFALGASYLHNQIFPKYPEILEKLQADCRQVYNRAIFGPVSAAREQEIEKMNIKSVYREIQFAETRDRVGGPSSKALGEPKILAGMGNGSFLTKKIGDRIGNQNLNTKIDEFKDELAKVSNFVNQLIDDCEVKLQQTLGQVQAVSKM